METKSLKKTIDPAQGEECRQNSYDMIVFCHLRWDFVYQRPQHIISRMARHYKILFVEEPWHREEQEVSRFTEVTGMLHVLQPNVHDIADIGKVLPQYVKESRNLIGWFYSPSFVPLIDLFDFSSVIYDCMDELSLFKGAPEALIEQERYLVANADIIFTGGKSLYESKSRLHKNTHCFPSSVDQAHFARALNGLAVPDDIAGIPSPIVGYFGVIDERIDLALLDEVAARKADVSFVMIGPLAKIGEDVLPKRPNIHYLGMKDYQDLPGYIKAFDLAMMPFALNDATKFISPTKTLEYMAAHKPIVSTPITDVVRDYAHCVSIVSNAAEFENVIYETLDKVPDPFIARNYNTILENTSWDRTVQAMVQHINAIAQ